MHVLSTILPALGFASLASAKYSLHEDYGTNGSFFDKFNFFTDSDPTNGYVDYVNRNVAQSHGLINASTSNGVYIGVDHSNTASKPGRKSVRLESSKTYQHGLVILDLAHMPGSVCGTWPAFWMLGSDWPSNGEIDIIEGVNDQSGNQMALHTSDGCTVKNTGFSGKLDTDNCYVDADGQSANAGCAIMSSDTQSFGSGFNDAGGGVYATEWTGSAISAWFFPSSSVPKDITSGSPDPSTWGTPAAKFAGSCDIDKHFKDLQIVFDITFCGDWAGEDSVWSSSSCSSKASTCNDYVQNNPSAFEDSYWRLNSLKVYQESSSSSGLDLGIDVDLDLDVNLGSSKRTAPYLRPGPRPKHRRTRRHGHGHA
ncbi:unnamed protein product [Penicillium salamii]|uniref:endo-1,3(4)-beta-glucanase n=1 Tax=Penicillium salamii TaxID=1612424 RepID=A0A9W4NVD8_9EURO|nr:unnamed protein product [Penicillium salamii]CAG8014865.1 unnamed protein product [Penicillium salamii]CAG8015865.1 unnamed protein product [Penicillium salamii]CAG8058173.1 unnamed protein product [Penicillium salamii]CAG8183963.1 unnamed protein product [Penicillium salamii]